MTKRLPLVPPDDGTSASGKRLERLYCTLSGRIAVLSHGNGTVMVAKSRVSCILGEFEISSVGSEGLTWGIPDYHARKVRLVFNFVQPNGGVVAGAAKDTTRTSEASRAGFNSRKPETYHVVFIDVVRYSRRLTLSQMDVVDAFTSIMKETVQALSLESRTTVLPTGDGAAVCIEPDANMPLQPYIFVCEFAQRVEKYNDAKLIRMGVTDLQKIHYWQNLYSDSVPAFAFRIGVTSGTLVPYEDFNKADNLAGTSLNDAARLLTMAGPNQAIFSPNVVEAIADFVPKNIKFYPLPSKTIKGLEYHGLQLVGPTGIDPALIGNRAQREPDPGLDDLPHVWSYTNHSDPSLRWNSVGEREDERAEVVGVLMRHYQKYIDHPREIERLGHARSSQIFRVADRDEKKEPILLKVQSRPQLDEDDEDIKNLLSIYDLMSNSTIFPSYGKYLKPLKTENDDRWAKLERENKPAKLVTAYWFLPGAKTSPHESKTSEVTHFAGKTTKEIKNAAQKLGRVNDLLIQKAKPNRAFLYEWKPDLWDNIIIELGKHRSMPRRTIYLAQAELDLIKEIYSEIKNLNVSESHETTLNDCHPHNMFVVDDRCIIIFDYEAARNDWPEVATCSFALHRLCREHVRYKVRRDPRIDVGNVIRASKSAFLIGYGKARPCVIERVKKDGIRWAKAVNFAKLMGAISFQMDELNKSDFSDPLNRPEYDQYREAIKFLSYLKELNMFASAWAE